MSTDRPATTDQQPAVYGATQPARLVITETVAASRTQGDGPWTTAEAILGALDRAGYTVAARASESPGDAGSPTPDVGAAQGGEGGSAAESEPRPMRPDDVPGKVLAEALEAWTGYDDPLNECAAVDIETAATILAAAIPAIRAQVADEKSATRQAEFEHTMTAVLDQLKPLRDHTDPAVQNALAEIDLIAYGDDQ